MHNGKYDTLEYKRKQSEKLDRLFGPILQHKKICICCNKEFVFEGRIKTKSYINARFCSRGCANNRQEWWTDNATRYRTLAFRHWEEKCVVCGFDKVVAVHHIDENKENNSPRNLIPLCPNHHEMIHHNKWRDEVQLVVDAAIIEKFGPVV
jgi:hypothetical protein